ncbi:MAG: DNA polymerase III subunit delta [Pyrinomonadaceae bacterium]
MSIRIHQRSELRNDLRVGKLLPVYFLYGEEVYLRDIAIRTISEKALAGTDLKDFNSVSLSLNETGFDEVLSFAQQLPFGGGLRVVIATDCSAAAIKSAFADDDAAERAVMGYLTNPAPDTVLIISSNEFDKRLRLSKMFAENSFVVEFPKLAKPEAEKWLESKFRELETSIEAYLVHRIVDLTGEDARALQNEAVKLATYSFPEKVVSKESVDLLVRHKKILSNFDLTDHLIAGRKKEALATARKILEDGAEPLMLLGLLSYNFRQLCAAKELTAEGADRRDIISTLRLRGGLDRFFEAVRRTDRGVFENAILRIAEVDKAIKTSVGSPSLQLEMLVCELAMGKSETAFVGRA